MQYREVSFTFPEEATDRDKLIMALQSPYSFVRWCRTQVGVAPSDLDRVHGDCVIEQYLRVVTGARTFVDTLDILVCVPKSERVITPTWAQRVIEYVDMQSNGATYHDVANTVMMLIQRGEIA